MDKLGTDEMHVASRNLLLEGNPNVATLDGKPVKVSNYLDHIVAGFASTYRLLAAWRQELTEGPLEASRGDEIRVILSATEIYAHIIRASYHPHYLRDALERDRILDRIWPFPEMGDPYLRVSPSERRDLQAGDIPYFSTRADSCDLLDSRNQRMPDFLPTSGFQAALKRLRGLCERDLERQIRCIRSTFATIPVGQDDNQAPSFVLKSPAGEAPPSRFCRWRRPWVTASLSWRLCKAHSPAGWA